MPKTADRGCRVHVAAGGQRATRARVGRIASGYEAGSVAVSPLVSIALTILAIAAVLAAFVRPLLAPGNGRRSRAGTDPGGAGCAFDADTGHADGRTNRGADTRANCGRRTTNDGTNHRTASGWGSPRRFDATFTTRQPGWPENAPFVVWANGAYQLNARTRDQFVAVAAPLPGPVGDFTLSGTFRKTGGLPGGGYGFVLRDQQTSDRNGANQTGRFYVVEIGDRGEIGMWRRDDDQWTDVLTWTGPAAVRRDREPNELVVHAVGGNFTLVVNSVEIASLSDFALAEGGVGLFAGSVTETRSRLTASVS